MYDVFIINNLGRDREISWSVSKTAPHGSIKPEQQIDIQLPCSSTLEGIIINILHSLELLKWYYYVARLEISQTKKI